MSSILAKLMWSRGWGARRQHPPGRGPHGPCWLHGTCKGRAWIRGARTALGRVVWERPGLSVSPDRGHDREQKRSVFTLNRGPSRAASASGSGARTEHAAFHTSSGTWTVPTGHRKVSLENTVQGMAPRLPPWTEPREGQRVRCSRRQAGRGAAQTWWPQPRARLLRASVTHRRCQVLGPGLRAPFQAALLQGGVNGSLRPVLTFLSSSMETVPRRETGAGRQMVAGQELVFEDSVCPLTLESLGPPPSHPHPPPCSERTEKESASHSAGLFWLQVLPPVGLPALRPARPPAVS